MLYNTSDTTRHDTTRYDTTFPHTSLQIAKKDKTTVPHPTNGIDSSAWAHKITIKIYLLLNMYHRCDAASCTILYNRIDRYVPQGIPAPAAGPCCGTGAARPWLVGAAAAARTGPCT